jgi:cytochrome oxidase Cu insertion factor (SCO1/SenC/PrrC family)
MVWLTGNDEEIGKVAKSFRVYYSAPESDEPG